MAAVPLPEVPAQLKAIQSYIKMAADIERADPVVSYWLRFYATETGFKIDKDSPQCKAFLFALITWLEQCKKTKGDNEAITNTTVGQAHYENFVFALFTKADTLDREGTANMKTIRMFYTAAVLFEAMAIFGPLTDDIKEKAKYAKFKAAYIQKCLKTGITPKPGPLEGADLQDPSASDELSNTQTPSEAPKLPEVPTSTDTDTYTKPDPFIMTPGSSPAPKMPMPMPPSTPAGNDSSSSSKTPSGYSMPSAMIQKDTPSSSNVSSATITTPSQVSSTISSTKFHATNGAPLNAEDILTGQKYCKFANSALQYDDVPTAVANLEKAIKLLTTGQRSS